jgi:protein-L-isoaspartate(D-aspartate) O-methyltransferase
MPAGAIDPFAESRERMVHDQLEPRDIGDAQVLRAMGVVPRQEFVPRMLRPWAYMDRPLLIGYDQTISQPFIVALMTQSLGLEGDERVLEVGTGSGYQTAVLAELCSEVYSIERIPRLSHRAAATLHRLGYRNVRLRVGDGTRGWPEAAPFDAILVTAGATKLPPAYRNQLREGGRLVIPIGGQGDQVLHRYTRHGDELVDEDLGRVAFVPLVASKAEEKN